MFATARNLIFGRLTRISQHVNFFWLLYAGKELLVVKEILTYVRVQWFQTQDYIITNPSGASSTRKSSALRRARKWVGAHGQRRKHLKHINLYMH